MNAHHYRQWFLFRAKFCLASLLIASYAPAQAATISWTNASGGNWGAAVNWSPNQVPGVADMALVTADGNYTVTLNANAQVAGLTLGGASGIQNLTVSGSTLSLTNGGTVGAHGALVLVASTLSGALEVDGALDCTNGAELAPESIVNVSSNAVMNFAANGGAVVYLEGLVTNAGTINWSGTGNILFYNYGPSGEIGGIFNLAGAVFNDQKDHTMTDESGSPFFNNAGTFIKSGGTNTIINVAFTNSGILNLAYGALTINNGGSINGNITGAGSLSVTGGAFTFGAPVPNLILNGGTVTGFNEDITNFTWISGNLQGTNTVTGVATWTSGTIGAASSLAVASNALLTINGRSGQYYYLNGPLINAGTVNLASTESLNLYYYPNGNEYGGIVNLPGAVFDDETDQTWSTSSGNPFFSNAGTFIKSGGSNAIFNITFTNSGVMDISNGTLTFNNGGVIDGTVTGSGSLTIAGGTMTLGGPLQNLILAGGTIIGLNEYLTNFTWNLGTVQGANTVTGQATWTGGTIAGSSSLTVASNAVLNITGVPGQYFYIDGPLTNAGTINWSGIQGLYIYNYGSANQNANLVNLPGALFNAQNDQTLNGQGSAYFENAGTFLKSAGTNTTINMLFTNTGVVDLPSGNLIFANAGLMGGTVTGAGTLTVTGSTFSLGTPVSNLVLNGGTLNGLNVDIGNLSWSLGTLQGASTVTGLATWTGGTIAGSSSLTVSSNAVLNITGVPGQYFYIDGPLTNAGTINWSGIQGLYIYNYGSANQDANLVNLAGALFNVQNDQTLNGEGSAYFENAGTFLKSAGTNTTVSMTFSNTGAMGVVINSPSNFAQINFPNGVTLGGTLNILYANTYSPATGDSFPLLTYASETGIFAATNLPPPAYWQSNIITMGTRVLNYSIGSIYKLAFATGPSATNTAGVVYSPIVVQTEYQNGSPLSTNGAPITMSMPGGNGKLSGTTTQSTDAGGQATFGDLSINLSGLKTLEAASAPWITPVSNTTMIIPAAPAQLIITKPIGALQKQGYPFTPGPTVQILDQFGNIASNATLAISAQSFSSGSGEMRGATTANANGTNGTAAFSDLYYNLGNARLAETVTPYFTSPGLVSATNSPTLVEFVSGLLTLTNGNSLVLIDPNSQNGMYEWKVDGIDQLSQHWHWLRRDPANTQLSFDQFGPPLGLEWTTSNATINYISNGLTLSLEYVLEGGAEGSRTATVTESISVQNTTNISLGLHLYDYADFDLAGQSDGDTVTFPGSNTVMQQGKNMIATQTVGGQTPSYWEGSWYALALDSIEEATPAVLADNLIPNQAGDQTFAFQWDFSLAAGQMMVLNLTNTIESAQALLAIVKSGTNVIISWPSNSPAVQNLQTGALNAGATWTNISSQPSFTNGFYKVTVPITNNKQFFRLEQ